jgi:hypothetical protein
MGQVCHFTVSGPARLDVLGGSLRPLHALRSDCVAGQINENVARSLDFVLDEAAKRDIRVTLVPSNFWLDGELPCCEPHCASLPATAPLYSRRRTLAQV